MAKRNFDRESDLDRLSELVKGIQYAMLTTEDAQGHLRSRPMATQGIDRIEGAVWFISQEKLPKVDEIHHHPQVNISYSDPDESCYVSISGPAMVVHDKEKLEELWRPGDRSWFPKGASDDNICLIRVNIEQAEYWDCVEAKMVHLTGFLKKPPTPPLRYGSEKSSSPSRA